MASITFKHVVKTYDNGVTVIPDLNLEIKDKEFVILVGPSGCGKSTTLRMIAGLESISDGDLYIGDRLINAVAPKNRDIAMVFQSYALYPHMTVYKNMAFALELRKMSKADIDKKVHEVAEILELEPYLNRKPKELSGGQRQRVALGRAMVREPSVFLLDEPLSNLDAKLRTEMRSQITSLHNRLQTTFVYVTHDQTEAMTMADRICVMKDGIVQQFDTPSTLYNHPANLFVAGFIGSPQMNFIDAVVEKGSDGYLLTIADGGGSVPVQDEALKDYVGKKVILGVRPEHFQIEEEMIKNAGSAVIRAKIDIVEMMGADTYLYFMLNGKKTIARIPAQYIVSNGDTVSLAFNKNQIHVFDEVSGDAIC